MTRAASLLVALTLSAGLFAQIQPSASPEILLKAAMQKEQVSDLTSAIAQYKVIAEKFPKASAAPKALLQLAGIYSRQGLAVIAREMYQRIAMDYPNSGDPATEARKWLTPLGLLARETELTVTGKAGDTLLGWFPDGHLLFASNRDGVVDALAVRVLNGLPMGAPAVVKQNIGGGQLQPTGRLRWRSGPSQGALTGYWLRVRALATPDWPGRQIAATSFSTRTLAACIGFRLMAECASGSASKDSARSARSARSP